MAFDKAKTSFAQIEDKFRKAFNLAGLIGATFEPVIRPVVNMGDLNEPGYASFRGRHFAWVSDGLSGFAANHVIGLKTPVDLVVTELLCASQSGGPGIVTAHYFAPDQTTAAITAILTRTNAGTWVDQKLVTADLVPFFDRANNVADATIGAACTFQNRIAVWAGAMGQGSISCGMMHVPAGGTIIWNFGSAAATGHHVGLYGRIF